MSVHPWFAHLIAERINSMWESLDKPVPFYVFEFGGGTGMLARDVTRFIRDQFPYLYDKFFYILGERSPELQKVQNHTTSEFSKTQKL